MKKLVLPLLLCLSLLLQAQENPLSYVKPITGTQKMGHTYPGATVPFGMVQLSPETDTIPYEMNGKYNPDVYKYCAGYQYEDKTIVGFSHTHFSGTGHSDLGDFLIMPTTGKLQLNPGTATHPETGYRSSFSHSTEVAEPAYYKVKLDDHNILAELTASNRVGFHQYTFPGNEPAHIILDMMSGLYNYDNKNVWSFIRVENDSLVTGFRQTNGWGRTRIVYFAMTFSKPFTAYGQQNYAQDVYKGFWRKFDQTRNFPEMAGKQLRTYFDFNTAPGEKIQIKFALSSVSTAGALRNLRTEIPGWDFNAVKAAGQELWSKELRKIQIESRSKEEKENFYTAMYHAFINPTTYMDVDGAYRGLDMNNHTANGYTNYSTFSLWDTYRALHPLFNVIQPQRNADMIQSMLQHYNQSVQHMLPIWSHHANENWCMIGYHSVSVIADAIIKGNAPFDVNAALDACVATARHRAYDGLGYYMDMGYIPEDKIGASVSKTLEYAYDDWCIAQIAQKIGRTDIYTEFIKRAGYYRNVFDARSGFMRPRLSDGTFKASFDALQTHDQGFIEGNAWNYSLYVPHDPTEMITMMGGKKQFAAHLDSLFTMELPDKYFAETEDITRDGIIGNYVHGNEPSHHVAYLYNYTGYPWKTQERVRMILKKMYHPGPDGLGGNDDCGQMSAWYIFSTLGFYPVCPGSDQYALGSPAIDKATLQLENGKSLVIKVKNQGDKNVYVQRVLLNGQPLREPFITHADMMRGGELTFFMGAKPLKQ
ncbi:GH92 family glycosyl hydrolase [Chitinophaga nivalis]|uniref:GH92 family glycosyl hydrolase n=1 Tax=Chitinophaga nivalis TaxID=2991709 RepID=A0ABT3ITQ6_9BACT|nr:GH92 family glycosyl hydrolase [Chitinophaga nivalis]MCW3462938.1 GH92 family glycosyl hydrolase [Chitinophaga nivalis]MCW3487372.1 GH92 family glycosyl hydrolase [Chitinophaga nivalis]